MVSLTPDLGLAALSTWYPGGVHPQVVLQRFGVIASDANPAGPDGFFATCLLCCAKPWSATLGTVPADAATVSGKYRDVLGALPVDLQRRDLAAGFLAGLVGFHTATAIGTEVVQLRLALARSTPLADSVAVLMLARDGLRSSTQTLAQDFRDILAVPGAPADHVVCGILACNSLSTGAAARVARFVAIRAGLPPALADRDFAAAILALGGAGDAQAAMDYAATRAMLDAAGVLDAAAAVLAAVSPGQAGVCRFRDLEETISPARPPRVLAGVCPAPPPFRQDDAAGEPGQSAPEPSPRA